MARRKKSRKSPAARAARAVKRRAKRAARKGRMPAGLKAYWAKRRGKAAASTRKPKRRRTGRKAKVRAYRRKSKARRSRKSRIIGGRHLQNSHEWRAGTLVRNPKRRRKMKRNSGKSRRRARRNPGATSSMSLLGGLKGFVGNVKDTFMGGGVKGFVAAAAGAGGAVFAGTLVDRITRPALAFVAPSLVNHPIVSRLLGGANYYLAGWALAKYVPGVGPRTRRAILTGASVAALVEVIKPGAVRGLATQLPVVGGLFGYSLEGMADGVGDYVAFALNGSDSHSSADNGGGFLQTEGDAGMSDYALADYALADTDDGMSGR